MNWQSLSRGVAIALLPFAMIAGACAQSDAVKRTNSIEPDASIVIPTVPMSTKSEEALRHIRTGLRYARTAMRNDQAYDEYKRAIAADTGFAYAYGLAGLAATDQLEMQRLGMATLAREGTANPSERLMIQSYEQVPRGNIKRMVTVAESLPILNPDNAASWEFLGVQQENAGDFVESLRSYLVESRHSYQKVVALDSQYAYGWFRLGNTYLREPGADTALAERYILTGVKLWPNEFASSFFLGRLRTAQNRIDDAVAAYSRGIALAQNSATGYKLRADLYAQTGRFQQARADYDSAIRLGTPDQTLAYSTARAFVSAYEGKFEQCLKELLDVEQAVRGVRARAPLEHEDTLTSAIFEMALRQQQFDVAKAAGERAFDTRKRLGYFDKRMGDPDTTVTSDQELRRRYVSWETDIAIAKGQFDVAAQDLRTMEKAGNYGAGGTNRYIRAMIAQGQKRYALAEQEYRRTRQDQLELYNLAIVVAAQGRPSEARAILETLLKRRSNVTWDDALVRYDAERMLKALSSADSTRKTEVGR